MARSVFRAIAFATLSSIGKARLFGPAPGPASAPAPGPAPLPPATDVITNFDKKIRNLPEQGYDELSHPDWVKHQDFDTTIGDWQHERPRRAGEIHDGDSTARACEEHPEYLWCNLYLRDRNRKTGPRVVHKTVKEYKKLEASPVPDGGGERVVERVARRQQEVEVEVEPLKVQNVAKEQKERIEKQLQGMEKGIHKTGDQAGDFTDEMSDLLPTGMWPSREQLEKRYWGPKKEWSEENGGDFPPGMINKDGSASPYEPVAFHAQPVAHKSMTDLR